MKVNRRSISKIITAVVFSVILTVAMMPAMAFPQTANAAAGTVTVGGEKMVDGQTLKCGSGTAVYDAGNKTLTLTNATVSGEGYGIYVKDIDINIILTGNNTVTGTYNNGETAGIYNGSNSITISGSGDLNVTAKQTGTEESAYGIYVGTALNMNGTGRVIAAENSGYSTGISSGDNIKVTNGILRGETPTGHAGMMSDHGKIPLNNDVKITYPVNGKTGHLDFPLVVLDSGGNLAPVAEIAKINNYTVTLNGNGGKAGTALANYYYMAPEQLPMNWKKTNYTFVGWYANAQFIGSAVNTISRTDRGNKTFYAKWKINKPAKPTKVKAKARSKKSIRVSWKKASRASGYKVYRATKKSGKYKYVGKTKKTYKTVTKLKKNKKYYFKVKAYNSSGSSSYSKIVKAKTKKR